MDPVSYMQYVRKVASSEDQDDALVMARIALNTLHDADGFPVDLDELMSLQQVNLAVTRSFLNRCAVEPRFYAFLDETCVSSLLEYVSKNGLGGAGEAGK